MRGIFIFFFFFLMLFIWHGECQEQLPCVPRDMGESSFVCVCNSTYCDTLPRPVLPPEGQFLLYTSDLASKRFLMTQNAFGTDTNGKERAATTVDLVLDSSTTFQKVMGWGGAFTDAAAANILSLSPDAQDLLLSSYFSTSGLEYNLGRINMGGCDFSWRTYTYVDTVGDVELLTFALQIEDIDFKIPIIKRSLAMAAEPVKLFASPWTAPPWMKTNNDYSGDGQLLPEMYQPWANYFVKFLDSYAGEGIDLWGVTAQNEPMDGYVPNFSFNSMGWTAEEQRLWVAENLGPTLVASGYDHVQLMILDGQRFEIPAWAETVLNDSAAAQYVDGIALHWYMDDYITIDRLDQTHDLFPEYWLLGTEACDGEGPLEEAVLLGSWKRLEKYAYDIIMDMNHWMTGWVDWNLALDMIGGPNWAENFVDSPIIVNQEADEFYKNPMFYALGHFSKFVKEGAFRVGLTLSNIAKVDAVAFKNPDQTVAIVILNRSEEEVVVNIQVDQRGTMSVNAKPHSLQTALFL